MDPAAKWSGCKSPPKLSRSTKLIQRQHLVIDAGDPEFTRHHIKFTRASGQICDVVLIQHRPGRRHQFQLDAGRFFKGFFDILRANIVGAGLHVCRDDFDARVGHVLRQRAGRQQQCNDE